MTAYMKAGVILLLVACSVFATWKVDAWRYGKQLAEQSGAHQADLTEISNRFQGTAYVVGDIGRAAGFNQLESSRMAASRASWFSLILKRREGSRSEFGIANPR